MDREEEADVVVPLNKLAQSDQIGGHGRAKALTPVRW